MKYIFKLLISTLIFPSLLLLTPAELHAQMFSVDDTQPRQRSLLGTTSNIGISWEFADFSFTGDGVSPQERLDFNDNILRLRFQSPGLQLGLGVGGALTGMNDNSYLSVSGRILNSLPLSRSPGFLLLLPIQITTDLKQVQQNVSDNEFQQSSLIFGTGLKTYIRANRVFDFMFDATPNYGFSFGQGSLFGGTLFRFDGSAKIVINNFINNSGLSLGYNFDYRRYNIEGDRNDYDFTANSITLGIEF